MTETIFTSAAPFASKDEFVRAIYARLPGTLSTLGPFEEEPKDLHTSSS